MPRLFIRLALGSGEQCNERAPVGRPLLTGGLRRRLPRDEFPTLRRFCPGVEEHEPQAAWLAVDLRLDGRAAGDECGVTHEAHFAIAAGHALVLRLARAQGSKPRSLGIGEPRGVGGASRFAFCIVLGGFRPVHLDVALRRDFICNPRVASKRKTRQSASMVSRH
jgi:hypothetical protein